MTTMKAFVTRDRGLLVLTAAPLIAAKFRHML